MVGALCHLRPRATSASCSIGSFPGLFDARRVAIAGARVRSRRRHPVQPQRRSARAGRRAGGRRRSARPRDAGLGQRRSGRRPRGAPEGAVHALAADGRARPRRLRRRSRSDSRARWRASSRPSASRSTTRRSSTSTPIRRTRSSAIARWPSKADEVARLGGASSCARCRAKGWPRAASTFRVMATRARTRITSCRSSSIRPIACAPWNSSRFARRFASGVAFIMTAHVLVPSLDEQRPATLSAQRSSQADPARRARLRGRDPQRRSRDEGGQRPDAGALRRRARRSRPGATACSSAAAMSTCRRPTLEALVKAVESGEIRAQPHRRCAASGCTRAKERFLAVERPQTSARFEQLRIGHRARRASGDRRGDGGVSVRLRRRIASLKPRRLRSRRPRRARGPGQPVQARRTSTPASRSSPASASSRCTTSASSRGRGSSRGAADTRVALIARRLARSVDCARIIAVRGGYGSAQLLPLLDTA